VEDNEQSMEAGLLMSKTRVRCAMNFNNAKQSIRCWWCFASSRLFCYIDSCNWLLTGGFLSLQIKNGIT